MSLDFGLQAGSGDDSSFFGYDSLLQYLSWIENSLIAWYLDELFPPEQVKRWVYTPVSLLKLAILQDTKKVSSRTLVSTLSAEVMLSNWLERDHSGFVSDPLREHGT